MSYSTNPLVAWLLSHAYGQGGTVAVPYRSNATIVPLGPFPPGVIDTLNRVAGNYANSNSDSTDWCFLVGGPGNGKSEALRQLASMLNIDLPDKRPGQPVPRVVPENWRQQPASLTSGHTIAFLNDASIPRDDADPNVGLGSLFLDLDDGLHRLLSEKSPFAFLVNVNRGILVEEANFLEKSHPRCSSITGKAVCAILRWLASPNTAANDILTSPEFTVTASVPIERRNPFYGQLDVKMSPGAVEKVTIHVVFLDALSLLEPSPGSGGPAVDFSSSPPRPIEYHTFGSLLSDDVTRDSTAAGEFVRTIVEITKWEGGGCKDPTTGDLCEAHSTCPFAQNAKWLQDSNLRHRFLDTLRAAEVAAGKRFTYRELLEHLSLAVVGRPEAGWLHAKTPCSWSADQHQGIGAGNKQAAFAVASHRIYGNMFASKDVIRGTSFEKARTGDTVYQSLQTLLSTASESARPQAFERAFSTIDPARDTDSWDGVRQRVLDAVEAQDVIPPSENVKQWSDVSLAAHSEIEAVLDRVIKDEIATELHGGSKAAGRRVRLLRRWRGGSLLRQVGLARGHIAFAQAIQAWLSEQENALRDGPRLSLGDGIHRLILPTQQGKVFLAPLRPRTYALIGKPPKCTVLAAINVNDLEVVIVPQGDVLVAEVQVSRARQRLQPLVLATLVVDLSIAREAMLHAQSASSSFTEIGHTAFARIERARASLVSRQRSLTGTVYFTDDLEKLFMVSPSPAGTNVRVHPVS